MAVHVLLPLLWSVLATQGAYGDVNNIALTYVPTEKMDDNRNVYECFFPIKVKYCLWYFNGQMSAPSQYKFKYEDSANGRNTNDCTISIPYVYLIFKKYQLDCVGIQDTSPTAVNIGESILLPCYSETPVYCEWVNSRNQKVQISNSSKVLFEKTTNCSLHIANVELWSPGLWTCRVKDTYKVLALHHLSLNTNSIHLEQIESSTEPINQTNFLNETHSLQPKSEHIDAFLIIIVLSATQASTIILIIILLIVYIRKIAKGKSANTSLALVPQKKTKENMYGQSQRNLKLPEIPKSQENDIIYEEIYLTPIEHQTAKKYIYSN